MVDQISSVAATDASQVIQVFRRCDGAAFNAAVIKAAQDGGWLISVETDEHGETVAIIHRQPRGQAAQS